MTHKPIRATLALLAYNQVAWLPEAIEACFAQQGEPIEILMSDDASTDGSYELMLWMASQYSGPHQVRVRRNPANLGIGGHYNQVIADSSGELIITAAGDDICLPDRVATILEAWDRTEQRADLIASHLIDMTFDGQDVDVIRIADLSRWRTPSEWTRKRPYVVGASHAFTRRMHERFGDFDPMLNYEDQIMVFRACCMGGGITIDRPLVKYRRGGLSSRWLSADNPDGYANWSKQKFLRQKVTYSQIHADMITAGLESLWRGKVRRYLVRSELALSMLAQNNKRDVVGCVFSQGYAGIYWTLRQILYSAWPGLPVALRKLRGK